MIITVKYFSNYRKTNKQYCCFSYYYDQGKCKACNPGSISLDGMKCVPCPSKTYGEMCKYNCNCSSTQNCDRQIGCIDISSAVTLRKSTEKYNNSHRLNATYSGYKRRQSSTTSSISTEQEETECEKKEEDPNNIFIYSLVVAGGLVGWLVFCFAGVRLLYKNIKRQPSPIQQNFTPTPEDTIRAESPVEHIESIYDEIEDAPVPSSYLTASHSHSYLSVQDDSEKSLSRSTAENNFLCEATASSPTGNTFEDNDASSENSHESFEERKTIENDDYLHPYMPLQDGIEDTSSEIDSAEIENKFETLRLTAQGRPVIPRSWSFEIFHDLTPTGEISIRVNQDQWPSQENTNRYDKDGIHHTDNRPLSGDVSPSRKLANDPAKNPEVSNRATVVHLEKNAARTVKQNFGDESRTLLVPLPQEPDHAARGSGYGVWSQKAMDNAQGDSGSSRRVMRSYESDAQRGSRDFGDLPRTLDRGVPYNQGTTYQALPLTSRGRFRVGVNGTDHEHRTDEIISNSNYAGISNEPIFDYDINLQNKKYYKKKPALYDGEGNWEDFLVQFELIAAINKWSDIEKALELATSLRGTAQSILTDLRPEMRTNFIQLTAALASRFQPENQAEMYRAQMKSKIRGRTEQIPVLGQDIKRLVRLAYPSVPIEVKEQLERDCFIDSLNDADMEWAIFQAKAKYIDNAIQVALEYEAFQNSSRKHGTKPVHVEIPPTCEMIVQGTTLQGIPHKVTGLIEPARPFLTENGCLIAMAVCWIEAYPIPDIQAYTICRAFIAEFISRYGIPRQIHTDRGAQFTSQLFKEIFDAFRIDKTFTTDSHPQSDGLVEREKKKTFDCTKCDQSYDLISQLKRHHSDRHGLRLKCNTDGCIFTCPESRRYMLRNHMAEQHAQYITAPMVNSEKYPLSPLRSPTPISLYEPTDINGNEFDFLYNACQESGVNLDFEPPRKVLIQEQPSEKGDANNNAILTPVSLKPRDLNSEYLMCPISPEILTYFTCSSSTQPKNSEFNPPTTTSVLPNTTPISKNTYLFSQFSVTRWKQVHVHYFPGTFMCTMIVVFNEHSSCKEDMLVLNKHSLKLHRTHCVYEHSSGERDMLVLYKHSLKLHGTHCVYEHSSGEEDMLVLYKLLSGIKDPKKLGYQASLETP
ncbi:unnamed protein product [Mytilus coruscus]|uniref:C2H2-type domain-containing protein n=1 Tax=Mytilus coruscus TaxID=42192 RepID=A0A6J8B586_MYTCO|nr:unnamed protein product [Mytilus coruscus]